MTGADTMVFFKALQSTLDLGNSTEEIPQVIPQVEVSKKTDAEAKIIDFCSVARSITEIANALGYKDRKTVHVYLDPLIEQGRIARTIPDKPKSPNQKYTTVK